MRKLLSLACIGGGLATACAASQSPALGPVAPSPTTTASAVPAAGLTLAQTGIVATWMDPAVDPCQDYFAYACGGFVKDTVIPADHALWTVGSEITRANEEFLRGVLEKDARGESGDPASKQLGDYYAACMDEDGAEKAGALPIKPLLDAIGTVKDVTTLGAVLTKLHSVGIFPLFNIDALQDFKDATHVIAALDQDGIGLPDRDYYLEDTGNLKEVRAFYAGHVERTLGLVGMGSREAKSATADVMRIETRIARLEQDKVARRDPYKVYHRVDRAGLPTLVKAFPWDGYFAALGAPDVKEISVNDPAYFTGVDALLREEKPTAWRHYLTWQVASSLSHHLSKPFVNEDFALARKVTGQKEVEPRWKRCVRKVDAQLGELLAQPYVAAKFGGDSKDRATALTRSIHDAMRAELEGLPWMDTPTRGAALGKLEKINAKVGYPERWRSYDFAVSRTDDAANVLAGRAFELRRRLAKVGKPVDKGEWDMTPPTVNAYYNPSLNEIVIPAGELQPPYFSRDFYAPVNLGDEGANTIGHELTHGFDDEGSQFDEVGNLRDWWSKDTKAKFTEATRCVQDQYSSYEAVPGVKLNGSLTSGENIADIGGVKLGFGALQAWKKSHPEERRSVVGYTDEQLFFLAYAQGWCTKETPELLEMATHSDPHSPARWRVNGPMADVPAFAVAYQCRAGTPMNDGKVCSVW